MATKITVNSNGSLKIEGDVELVDGSGAAYDLGDRKTIFLCRCGQSQKSPFCDGSHKSCGFDSPAVARSL